jgi:hypothetical protein
MIRRFQPGDSRIRLALFEPREAHLLLLGAFVCRAFRLHGLSCRGRMDHRPPAELKGRWLEGKWA